MCQVVVGLLRVCGVGKREFSSGEEEKRELTGRGRGGRESAKFANPKISSELALWLWLPPWLSAQEVFEREKLRGQNNGPWESARLAS
jgi:hypothetical protein